MSVVDFPSPPARHDPDTIWERVSEVAGLVNLLHSELVDLTAQAIELDCWGGQGGIRSPEHWLTLRAGLSPATAAQITTLARARTRLPVLAELVTHGRLSLDQASTVAARVPAAYEASVCELAPLMTVTQLRRTVNRYPFDPDPPAVPAGAGTACSTPEADAATGAIAGSTPAAEMSDATIPAGTADSTGCDRTTCDSAPAGSTSAGHTAEGTSTAEWPELKRQPAPGAPLLAFPGRAEQPSRVTIGWDDGRFIVHADLDAADGALVENALREAKDALFTSCTSPTVDSRTSHTATATAEELSDARPHPGPAPSVTLTDALIEIASRSLGAVESPARASHYRVHVHLDTEGAWVGARGTLAYHLASRLGCTADTAIVWHAKGRPVSVGRNHRATPERLRRLVEDRDRGCAYPGCVATRFVEIHHIVHWADGGGTDYDNLISLCPHHHDAHHNGSFTITVNSHVLRPFSFHTRQGFPIEVPAPDPLIADVPVAPARDAPKPVAPTYRPPLGERLDTDWIYFRKHAG